MSVAKIGKRGVLVILAEVRREFLGKITEMLAGSKTIAIDTCCFIYLKRCFRAEDRRCLSIGYGLCNF